MHELRAHQLELETQNLELRQPHPIDDPGQLYEHAPVGYIDLDSEGRVTRINAAAAAILGSSREPLIGKSLIEFAAAPQRAAFREFLETCKPAEARVSAEITLHSPARGAVEVELLSIPHPPHRCRLALTDITEIKQAEATILRLAAFPRFNPNPVMELNEEGKVTCANEAAHKLAGSLGFNDPAAILPADTRDIVKHCFRSNGGKSEHENRIGRRSLLWQFFPIMPSRVVHCYGTDITERLALEAQVRQAQKLESVGQFAAGVAHDFNNILTIIQGYSSLVLSLKDLPDQVVEPIKLITAASERAANLTQQLLTFSRKQVLHPAPVNLNDIISGAANMLRRLLGEHIALQFNFSPNLPPIRGEAGLIEQVLMNLALNARDAMSKGGKLTIGTKAVVMTPEAAREKPEARPGGAVCLSVSDTGTGMDAVVMSKIFEPFFSTKGGGTGLGLAIVYGIVRQHQGWIDVESQVERGATFHVFFPITDEPVAPKPSPTPAPDQGTETIFVVEDEPALRELVVRQLKTRGYHVIEAATGTEALGIWPENAGNVDLLFTDMVMPDGMTGRDLAETLLAQKPGLKVIYTSGYSAEVVEEDFSLRKGIHFLQKPYQPGALLKTVREALDEQV
jgi:two-component system, cell cycle sensor histidine kinase and response regulator CckA